VRWINLSDLTILSSQLQSLEVVKMAQQPKPSVLVDSAVLSANPAKSAHSSLTLASVFVNLAVTNQSTPSTIQLHRTQLNAPTSVLRVLSQLM
jgi:hypothetical protein